MNHQRSTPWEKISEGLGKEFKPELRHTPDEKHMDQESFLFILLNVWDVYVYSHLDIIKHMHVLDYQHGTQQISIVFMCRSTFFLKRRYLK